ncbi:MAG: flagellar basal body-associated FliL family protein [Pseudomonadota bacterium]
MKKKSAAPKAGSPPDSGGTAAPAAKKGGKLGLILTPIAVFAGAFGASWLGGSPAPAPVVEQAETSKDEVGDIHAEDESMIAAWLPGRHATTLALEPLTITAGSQGQTLRIGLAIEVWDADAPIDVAKLRDAFTTYLRALEPEMLSDPSFHMRLKRALLHRARVVTEQDIIADVLITDFLLTS